MNKDAVFSDYKIKENPNRLVIKGYLVFKMWEKACIFLIFLFISVVLVNYIFRFINFYVLDIICLIVAFIAYKKIRFGVSIFTIDKKSKKLTANIDKLETPIDELKEIKIIERVNEQDQIKLYGLRYFLPDSEINSNFSFNNYNKIEEVVNVLKQNSK